MAHAEQLHQVYIQAQCQVFDQLAENKLSLAMLKVWHERSKQRRVLGQLSSESLRDIGLSRAEAQLESQKWFWEK